MSKHDVPAPKTLLLRFVTALARRDIGTALNVLATAAERRALPRRLLFGQAFDRSCHTLRRGRVLPPGIPCSDQG